MNPSFARASFWLAAAALFAVTPLVRAADPAPAPDVINGVPIVSADDAVQKELLSLDRLLDTNPALEEKLVFTATLAGSYEDASQIAGKWGSAVDDSVIHQLVQRLGRKAEEQTQAAAAGTETSEGSLLDEILGATEMKPTDWRCAPRSGSRLFRRA